MKNLLKALLVLPLCTIGFVVLPAFAASSDGKSVCNYPTRPSYYSYNYEAFTDVNGHCTGPAVASWRVVLGLSIKDINWGPLPDDWDYQAGSYGTTSTWAASGAYRYKERWISCTDIPDNKLYRGRARYQTDWTDGHLTYGYYESDDRRLCY